MTTTAKKIAQNSQKQSGLSHEGETISPRHRRGPSEPRGPVLSSGGVSPRSLQPGKDVLPGRLLAPRGLVRGQPRNYPGDTRDPLHPPPPRSQRYTTRGLTPHVSLCVYHDAQVTTSALYFPFLDIVSNGRGKKTPKNQAI